MSDRTKQKEKDYLSKSLSEDFVTPSENPLSQTQSHLNNDRFYEQVMGTKKIIVPTAPVHDKISAYVECEYICE